MKWVTRVEIQNGEDILVVGSGSSGKYELESCQVDLQEKRGTFSFTIRSFDDSLVNRFPPRKTTIKIYQGTADNVYHLITGFLDSPPVRYFKKTYQYTFEGVDYTAKMQDILVNEAYENKTIDYIVNDLLDKYLSEFQRNVEVCQQTISIKFKNKYLYDCFEQISKVVGWNFKIDKELVFRFWNPQTRINPNVLTIKNCKPNFDFKQDITRLVTRLRVEGAKKLSDDQTITFTGDGSTKIFKLPQRDVRAASSGDIEVYLNDERMNLGIKNIDDFGDSLHFLFDATNSTIETDLTLTSSDVLKVTYRYEYPIFYVIDDFDAQAEYGIIERVYKPNATDEAGILEEANRYLAKYKKPIYTGSIEPFFGYYEPGELVRIILPKLKIDDYLKITSVQYSGTRVQNIKLNIEETLTDADLLKSIIQRLQELEESNKQDGPVEQANMLNDAVIVLDTHEMYLHNFLRCGATFVGENGTFTNLKEQIFDMVVTKDDIRIYPHNYWRAGQIYASEGVFL